MQSTAQVIGVSIANQGSRFHSLALSDLSLVTDDQLFGSVQRDFRVADQLDDFDFFAVIESDPHSLPAGNPSLDLDDVVFALAAV